MSARNESLRHFRENLLTLIPSSCVLLAKSVVALRAFPVFSKVAAEIFTKYCRILEKAEDLFRVPQHLVLNLCKGISQLLNHYTNLYNT